MIQCDPAMVPGDRLRGPHACHKLACSEHVELSKGGKFLSSLLEWDCFGLISGLAMTPTCSWSSKFQVASSRRIAKAPGYWSLTISTPRHHACRAVLSRHSRLVRAWHSHRQRPKATADASAKAGHSLYASDGYSWNFDTSTPRYQDTASHQLEGSITSLHWGQRIRTFFLE